MQAGDEFVAIVLKGRHSKNFDGRECAGRRIGPMVATDVISTGVEVGPELFYPHRLFEIKKLWEGVV